MAGDEIGSGDGVLINDGDGFPAIFGEEERSNQGNNQRVHGDGNLPAGFGAKELAAMVEINLAERREVASLIENGRRDGKRRLKMAAGVGERKRRRIGKNRGSGRLAGG
uniref:DUF834 domain-containing protein n=2 Tax=Oryza sativa subsp. japonica TaxID=39947 RepID=Q53KE4_ORYSJ|nr:hypothetical protein LOC_Os11g22490 [Oryza sativa Japonica Group]ABA93168.1 hypothetical protein LOC_Os11g22490 [Oryza sativa Japonica Group]